MRIGLDGLAIAEVDNAQQDYDRPNDRHNVVHAHEAERNKQRERSLRSVCGGAQGIEAEDGDAGEGANVLGALFAGGEGTPKEQIQYVAR